MSRCRFVLAVFFLAFLFLVSCSEPVSLEWKGERRVYVHCIMTADSMQRVRLNWVPSVQDGRIKPVDSAQVVIYDKWYAYSGKKTDEGEWTVMLTPEEGMEYQLEINVPDGTKIQAKTVWAKDISWIIKSDAYQPECWLEEEAERIRNEEELVFQGLGHGQMLNMELYEQFLSKVGQATTFHHEMPGLIFLIKEKGICYITAAWHGRNGQLTPLSYLATNHPNVDNFNTVAARYRFEDYFSPSGNTLRDRYDKNTFSRYDGLVMHEGFLRIDQRESFDNGLRNVYSVSNPSFFKPQLKQVEDASQYFTVVGAFANPVFDKTIEKNDEYPVIFLSMVDEAYDKYLRYVYEQKKSMEGDLISRLYSDHTDIPGNIEGGCGIFGTIRVQAIPIHYRSSWKTNNGYYEPPRL